MENAGLYHILEHLSTDNIVCFLFLSSSVNSKAGKKVSGAVAGESEYEP